MPSSPPTSLLPSSARRILFITNTRLGDAVLSMGVLDHLLTRYPDARITVACGPIPAPVFRAAPVEVIAMTKLPWRRQWLNLWAGAVTQWWDLVVDLRGSLISWLLPARARIVFRHKLPDAHRVVELANLIGLRDAPPAPRLWTRPEHASAAAALIPEDGTPVLAIGPTANWQWKQWPVERFVDTVARLTAPGAPFAGARVAVLAAPDERTAAAPLLDSLAPERRIDLIGASDLAVMGACLKRCALYIGNDSGLMHLAAAAGVPTVGLFGPSREERYAPWGDACAVVRGAAYDDIMAGWQPDGPETTLMGSITVDAVVAAATRLYSERGREGS